MKKALITLIISLLLFTGCSGINSEKTEQAPSALPEFNVKFFKDGEWSKAYSKEVVTVSYKKLLLTEESENMYPSLAQAIETMNTNTENGCLETFRENIEYAKEATNFNSPDIMAYTSEHNLNVVRADKKIVSVLNFSYNYSGGAHGYGAYLGKNFHTESGIEVELSDIVKNIDELPEIIEAELISRNPDKNTFFGSLNIKKHMDEYGLNWFIGYDGITFIFNPYEIGPYAAGVIVAPVLYNDYPHIFNQEFFETNTKYFTEIPLGLKNYMDFDNDGEADELYIYHNQVDNTLKFSLNNKETEFECLAYSLTPILLHLENGKNYIYIEREHENGIGNLEIFEYENGEFNSVNTFDFGTRAYSKNDTDYWYGRIVISDPASFRLTTKTDVLGTFFGTLRCFVDQNGFPDSREDSYVIEDKPVYYVNQSFDAELTDSGKTVTVQAGSSVTYTRTDDLSFAELILPDKKTARIHVSAKEWPRTLNGVNIEDIFDGIEWAG